MISEERRDKIDTYFSADQRARLVDSFIASACSTAVMLAMTKSHASEASVLACAAGCGAVILALRIALYEPSRMFHPMEQPSKIVRTFKTWPAPLIVAAAVCAIVVSSPREVMHRRNLNSSLQKDLNDGLGASTPAQKPSSALTKNLSNIAETVNTAIKTHSTGLGDVAPLSATVKSVVTRYPDVAEGWRAASELVSYRSLLTYGDPAVALPDCFEIHSDLVLRLKNSLAMDRSGVMPFFVTMSTCTLNLDVSAEYQVSESAQFFRLLEAARPGAKREILLDNAIVTYSGGNMIPIDRLVCRGCTFRFSPPGSPPPPRGQQLTRELLTADLRNTDIQMT